MTPFVPKDWKDSPDTSTPLSAAAMEDLETRVTDYARNIAPTSGTTGLARATADLTLSTSLQDVAGATVTFTPDVPCYALVTMVAELYLDMRLTTSGVNSFAYAVLVVDGTPETAIAELDFWDTTSGGEQIQTSVAQIYRVGPLSATSHTLKIRALKGSAASLVAKCIGATSAYTGFSYQLVAQ